MREEQLILQSAVQVTREVYRLVLTGCREAMRPGQFVNLSVPGFALRRPISVCSQKGDQVTLLIRASGNGTRALAALPAGTALSVLTGLGNGFDLSKAGDAPLLVGGGVGVPPLLFAAERLRAAGTKVTVCLGFGTAGQALCVRDFERIGCEVNIATLDGTLGTEGLVTAVLPESASRMYACGPMPMLRALCELDIPGEVSLEARMGCGYGACMGCSLKTKAGMQRVCREGPVFEKEVLVWDD